MHGEGLLAAIALWAIWSHLLERKELWSSPSSLNAEHWLARGCTGPRRQRECPGSIRKALSRVYSEYAFS